MSKSLGTGIDPLDLIDGGPRPPVFAEGGEFPAYGADAVRWGLLAMSSGQDVRFSEEKVAQGQQLTNKLWNASRLILLRIEPEARAAVRPGDGRGPLDPLAAGARQGRGRRRGSSASTSRTPRSRSTTSSTASCATGISSWSSRGCTTASRTPPRRCCTCSTETLALAHPMIPFVTEEIYGHMPGAEGLLAGRARARAGARSTSPPRTTLARAIEAVQALRGWRDAPG